MYRYFIILFIFIINTQNVLANTAAEESSCVLEKKTRGSDTVTPLCSATLLDQTTLIYNNSCMQRVNPRMAPTISYQVSCAAGLVKFDVPKTRTFSTKANFAIHKLEDELPFTPNNHFNGQAVKDCFVQGHNREYPIRGSKIADDVKRLNASNSLKASPIYCESNENKKILMGIIDENAEFKAIDKLKQDYSLNSNFEVGDTNYTDDTISSLCSDTSNCLGNLIKPAIELNEQLNAIIEKLSAPEILEDRQELADEFRAIERECHRKNINESISYENIEEAGMSDKAVGVLEKSAIGLARAFEAINPFDKEDFLLTRFKDTEAIAENLSEAEILETFNRVNAKDISNFEKIKELATAYSTQVVNKLVDEMGTFQTESQKQAFLRPHLDQLKACLRESVSSSQVKECTSYFTDNIALNIGEKELARQIGLNFSAEDNIASLTARSTNEYMKCVDRYIKDFKKIIETTAVVKGCVYSGILSSYQQARFERVNAVVKNYTGKENNTDLVNNILSKANTCQYAPVLNKREQTSEGFLALAQLETEQFTQKINECIESLKKNATFDVVELAISTNPKINESLTQEEKQQLIDEIKNTHLPACLRARNTNDGNECTKFITAMATAKAAKYILEQEFQSQLEKVELSEEEKNQIKERLLAQYETCTQNSQETFYQDLAKDPDENLINLCLTGAIQGLASAMLGPMILTSTKEKNIDEAVVAAAIPAPRLSKLRSELSSCLGVQLGRHTSLTSYQDHLNESIDHCSFKSQQSVIESIALETAGTQIGDYNLSGEQTQQINEFIRTHIRSSNGQNLDERVDTLTPLLIKKVAPIAIEKTLEDFKSKLTKEEYEQAAKKINDQLSSCLDSALTAKANESSYDATKQSQICMAITVKDAYKDLAPKIITETIASLFPGEDEKVRTLATNSSADLMSCLNAVENNVKAQEEASKCLATNIGPIAKTVAHHLITDLNAFANSQGRQEAFTSSKAFKDFEQCIDSPNSQELEDVTKNMNTCVEKLEADMKGAIRGRFVATYGQDSPQQIGQMVDMLLLVPGKSQTNNFKDPSSASGMPNANLLATLEMIGETMKYSCGNNEAICNQHIHNATIQMAAHREANPEASTEENTEALMQSDAIDNIIMSKIGMTLNEVLKGELKDYNDSDNLLFAKIDEITSNGLLNQLMGTPEGIQLKNYIKEKIKNDELNGLEADTELRSKLSSMLTADTSKGSFGDILASGLVQTQLNQLRRRSSGFKGLFKEFTIRAGDFLNIIDRRDFKWDTITQTNTGQQARRFFIQQILAPAVAGDKTSAHEDNRRIDRFKEMITEALKEANK